MEKDTRQWLYHKDNEPTMFDSSVDDMDALKKAGWVKTPWEVKHDEPKNQSGAGDTKPDRKALIEEAKALGIEFKVNIKTDALIELVNTAKANKDEE